MNEPIKDWQYYKHCVISRLAPHETPNLKPIEDGSIWHIDGKRPIMARYTTNWDCGYDTGWWNTIKDSPFDISALKTKRRYEITRALRFFDVKEIEPLEYIEALSEVQEQAFSAYPPKYRPKFDKNIFKKRLETRSKQVAANKGRLFGAFERQTNKLVGFNFIDIHSTYIHMASQKTNPAFEKYGLNAALVYGMLESCKDELSRGIYINDGSRSISHETHFQDYLEKYFGFRKCYSKLKIAYPPPCKFMITILHPFRLFFALLGSRIGIFHLVSSILRMDEIARKNH